MTRWSLKGYLSLTSLRSASRKPDRHLQSEPITRSDDGPTYKKQEHIKKPYLKKVLFRPQKNHRKKTTARKSVGLVEK